MIPIFSTCIKFSMFINLALTFYLQAYSHDSIMKSLRINCQLFLYHTSPLTGNYISQYRKTLVKEVRAAFPSPYGELHFSILQRKQVGGKSKLVSVPLRGITFLNTFPSCIRIRKTVSVPLRGITFLNMTSEEIKRICNERFPSPYGELHFSIV